MFKDEVALPLADETQSGGRESTAAAIVKCLDMLALEAADCALTRTLAALRQTIEICHAEGGNAGFPSGTQAPGSTLLH